MNEEKKSAELNPLIAIQFGFYIYRLGLAEAHTIFKVLEAVHDKPEVIDMVIRYREDDTMQIYPPFISEVYEKLKAYFEERDRMGDAD